MKKITRETIIDWFIKHPNDSIHTCGMPYPCIDCSRLLLSVGPEGEEDGACYQRKRKLAFEIFLGIKQV